MLRSLAAVAASFSLPLAAASGGISLEHVGTYSTNTFQLGGAEISAHDPGTQRIFTVNAATSSIDVIDVSDPANPVLVRAISILPFGGGVNSVAWHDGILAAAIEATVKQDPGTIAFFDADGLTLGSVPACALPDNVVWTNNGRYALSACEGEPNDSYTNDPEGGVAVVRVAGDRAAGTLELSVRIAGFQDWNSLPLDPSVRVFGPGSTPAQDFEPEYLTTSHDSKTAWVTLQENNAIAIIDIDEAAVVDVVGLGYKNHNLPGNGLDPSDRDSATGGAAIKIRTWPVSGMYLPDTLASFRVRGETYLLSANEGDAREYLGSPGYVEERRINDSRVVLDPTVFPNAATLKKNANLGRLRITTSQGDTDGDGDYDVLYSFGGRSMSVWNADVGLVADTGDEAEQVTAAAYPTGFNSTHNSNNSFDSRSTSKGPEPEALTVGHLWGRHYAFLGLERIGGIMIYDVENPTRPELIDYVNRRDFSGSPAAGTAGDLGPEGVLFIKADDSPTGQPMLVTSNEISGTVSMFNIVR